MADAAHAATTSGEGSISQATSEHLFFGRSWSNGGDRNVFTTILFAALLFWMLRRCTWSLGTSVLAAATSGSASSAGGSSGSSTPDDKRAVLVRDNKMLQVQCQTGRTWSCSYTQGRRAHMEDRFTVKLNIPFPPASAAAAASVLKASPPTSNTNLLHAGGAAEDGKGSPPQSGQVTHRRLSPVQHPQSPVPPASPPGPEAETLAPALLVSSPGSTVRTVTLTDSARESTVEESSNRANEGSGSGESGSGSGDEKKPNIMPPPSPHPNAKSISPPTSKPPSPPRSPANAINGATFPPPPSDDGAVSGTATPCESPTSAAGAPAAPLPDVITPVRVSLFAVFDGHGGHRASDCATRWLPDFVRTHSLFPHEPRTVLADAFKQTDHQYVMADGHDALYQGTTAVVALITKSVITRGAPPPLTHSVSGSGGSSDGSDCKQAPSSTGSRKSSPILGYNSLLRTVITITVANAGDSRAILIRSFGTAVPLSHDHKPNRTDERTRIEAAGGYVIRHSENGRMHGPFRVYTSDSLGGLAVSRAFGDSVYRQPPHADAWLVNPTPDIITHTANLDSDQFIVLASDGLWDVFSNSECAAFIVKQNAIERGNLERIAAYVPPASPFAPSLPRASHLISWYSLVSVCVFVGGGAVMVGSALLVEAFRRGSGDNITVLLVNLQTLAAASANSTPNNTPANPSPVVSANANANANANAAAAAATTASAAARS